MLKFLSQLSNKKSLVFIFLLLVIGGLVIPQISYADWHPACWEWLWGKSTPGTYRGDLCYYSSENNKAALDTLNETVKWTFSGLVLAAATIIIGAFGSLAVLASQLFTTVLGLSSNTSMCYTCFDNAAIKNGWPMVKDLANMFIVFGFVIIGIATALRIQTYQATKLLPKLIGVALLINFSLVICGIFIDGSNVAMLSFTKGGGYLATSAIGNVANQTSAIWSNWNMNAASDTIGTAVGIAFYDVLLFVVFMLYACLFLFRYIVLWILVILSPLAFVCFVFPFTNKYFTLWWSNFLGWCIIGIPAGLFMFISDKIASNFGAAGAGGAVGGTNLLGYLVPCFFLVAGFLISLQTSAMGAGAVMGFAKGALGFSMGAASKAGLSSLRGLDKATGSKASAAGQAISSATGRTMERLGLKQTGSTAMGEAGRIEKERKGYEAAYNTDPAAKARIQQLAKSGKGVRAAAAMEVVAKENDLHGVFKDPATGIADLDKMNARVSYARSFGSQGAQYVQKDPRLAQFDKERGLKVLKDNPTWNDSQVGSELIRQAVQKTAPSKAAEWTPDMMGPEVFTHLSNSQLIEIGKRGSPGLVEKVKDYKRGRNPNAPYNVRPYHLQNEGYKKLHDHTTSFGINSAQAQSAGKLLNELESNPTIMALFK